MVLEAKYYLYENSWCQMVIDYIYFMFSKESYSFVDSYFFFYLMLDAEHININLFDVIASCRIMYFATLILRGGKREKRVGTKNLKSTQDESRVHNAGRW